MPLHRLTLESLGLLEEGKGTIAFQTLLDRAAADCEDRPTDTKSRKVTLQIDMIPVLASDLTCTEVKAVVKAKLSVPDYKTRDYSFALRKTSKGVILAFSEDSPSNVNQATMFEEEDES